MVEVAGGAIACREWATAAPTRTVLLLHGYAGDSLTWAGIGPVLAERGWRVVAADMPGHGSTPIEADDAESLVSPLMSLVEQLDAGDLQLVGHSLGGFVGTKLAMQCRGVHGVTLLAPAGLGQRIDPDLVRAIAAIESGTQLRDFLASVAARPPSLSMAELDALAALLGPPGRLKQLAEALGATALDLLPDLAQLAIPCRVLLGLEDTLLPWQLARAVPPRVAVHFLPDAKHALHWDQPEIVADLIDRA